MHNVMEHFHGYANYSLLSPAHSGSIYCIGQKFGENLANTDNSG